MTLKQQFVLIFLMKIMLICRDSAEIYEKMLVYYFHMHTDSWSCTFAYD